MARIRTVKPELFRHEGLQDLEIANPELRPMLVFVALFGHCDKNGVFEWRPRTLKLDILPFVDFDLSASLMLLWEAEFVSRFIHGEKTYGYIPTFKEHQRISGKELQDPSKLPEPKDFIEKKQPGSTGEAPGKHPVVQEGKGREGKGKDGGADAQKEYAFVGNVIRLTKADLARWRKSYPNVPDIVAELQAADDYYTEHPPANGKWFFAVSNWLKRANEGHSPKPKSTHPAVGTPEWEAEAKRWGYQ